MPTPSARREKLLARLLRDLAELLEQADQTLTAVPLLPSEPATDSSSGRQQEPELNPTETAILAALVEAQRPLKAVVLARKSGCNCNSHFRGVLSSLRERGLVRHVEEGYLPTTC